MLNALLVFIGGGTGAMARHFMAIGIKHHTEGKIFPYHTLGINLLGALLIGVIMEIMALRTSLPQSTQFLLETGFLGGFTTFSAFSLECSLLLERGDYASAAAYIGASVIGCIALVFVGAWAVHTVL